MVGFGAEFKDALLKEYARLRLVGGDGGMEFSVGGTEGAQHGVSIKVSIDNEGYAATFGLYVPKIRIESGRTGMRQSQVFSRHKVIQWHKMKDIVDDVLNYLDEWDRRVYDACTRRMAFHCGELSVVALGGRDSFLFGVSGGKLAFWFRLQPCVADVAGGTEDRESEEDYWFNPGASVAEYGVLRLAFCDSGSADVVSWALVSRDDYRYLGSELAFMK